MAMHDTPLFRELSAVDVQMPTDVCLCGHTRGRHAYALWSEGGLYHAEDGRCADCECAKFANAVAS